MTGVLPPRSHELAAAACYEVAGQVRLEIFRACAGIWKSNIDK